MVYQSIQQASDDMKDEVLEDEAGIAQLRQQGPALVFPSEVEVLDRIFLQVRHEEGLIALSYRGPHQQSPSRGTKRRKQDTETPSAHCCLLGIQWYHWPPAAEDGVRAGANSAEDAMRAGTRFTVSPFDWSCLCFCLGSLVCFLGVWLLFLLLCCFCLLVFPLTRPFHS